MRGLHDADPQNSRRCADDKEHSRKLPGMRDTNRVRSLQTVRDTSETRARLPISREDARLEREKERREETASYRRPRLIRSTPMVPPIRDPSEYPLSSTNSHFPSAIK